MKDVYVISYGVKWGWKFKNGIVQKLCKTKEAIFIRSGKDDQFKKKKAFKLALYRCVNSPTSQGSQM